MSPQVRILHEGRVCITQAPLCPGPLPQPPARDGAGRGALCLPPPGPAPSLGLGFPPGSGSYPGCGVPSKILGSPPEFWGPIFVMGYPPGSRDVNRGLGLLTGVWSSYPGSEPLNRGLGLLSRAIFRSGAPTLSPGSPPGPGRQSPGVGAVSPARKLGQSDPAALGHPISS